MERTREELIDEITDFLYDFDGEYLATVASLIFLEPISCINDDLFLNEDDEE